MSIPETVSRYLESNNIQYELLAHPVSFSAHDTSLASHVDPGHIAKGVIVKSESGFAMVVIVGNDWLKLNTLGEELGQVYELADENEIVQLFSDCKTGAIPALGKAYGINTFYDERLNSLANIYFEAGDHENLVHIKADQFQTLFKGCRHGHFSH